MLLVVMICDHIDDVHIVGIVFVCVAHTPCFMNFISIPCSFVMVIAIDRTSKKDIETKKLHWDASNTRESSQQMIFCPEILNPRYKSTQSYHAHIADKDFIQIFESCLQPGCEKFMSKMNVKIAMIINSSNMER